jgi:predicted membrane metal-binding protein
MSSHLHEDLNRETEEKTASERSFGILFAVVFAVIAFWPLLKGDGVRWWALAIAIVFAVFAFLAPGVLKPLNRAWMAVGRLLNKIVSPVVLGLLYIVAVVPTGLALRLTGKDPLRLKLDRKASTYWQKRDPAGHPSDSFKNQF